MASKIRSLSLLALALCIVLADAAHGAKGFPEITAEQRALTQVAAHPEAAAVVLSHTGELTMAGTIRSSETSVLRVHTRIKILSEQGMEDYGQLSVVHNRHHRLRNLDGRTVLPDGRQVPLDDDSVFVSKSSDSLRLFTTSVAFPALEVGAILDYSYEIKVDSIFYIPTWVFQREIPTLHSEITYRIPQEILARAWTRDPLQHGIETATERTAVDYSLRAWSNDLPPIPDEAHGFPAGDLATQMTIVPAAFSDGTKIFDTWTSTCDNVEVNYHRFRRGAGKTKRTAKTLVADLRKGSKRDQAQAIYRFVRDEIGTVETPGILVWEKASADAVLKDGQGDLAEKGLVLQIMLDAVGIDAKIVWAADRDDGMVDAAMPHFDWFDRVLVRASVDGETVFLDPGRPGLPFGAIGPDQEGTVAVLFDRRKPEILSLPFSSLDANRRAAELDLRVDDEGRVVGTGRLSMRGHSAMLRYQEDGAGGWWTSWLERAFGGFEISDVTAAQDAEKGSVEVTWKLAQTDAEVLGDEVTLTLSRPFGPERQRFVTHPNRRTTPVRLPYANQSEVRVKLTWPEGWSLDAQPSLTSLDNGAGRFRTGVQVDLDHREILFTRTFALPVSQLMQREQYGEIRALYAAMETSDGQSLVLLRD